VFASLIGGGDGPKKELYENRDGVWGGTAQWRNFKGRGNVDYTVRGKEGGHIGGEIVDLTFTPLSIIKGAAADFELLVAFGVAY